MQDDLQGCHLRTILSDVGKWIMDLHNIFFFLYFLRDRRKSLENYPTSSKDDNKQVEMFNYCSIFNLHKSSLIKVTGNAQNIFVQMGLLG